MLTGDILRLSADRHPNKIAFIYRKRLMTYGEVGQSANRFANGLMSYGISIGDTWAIMSRNSPEYAISIFGGSQTGGLLVNLLPAYAPDELVTILNKTKVTLIVVEEIFQEKISTITDRLPNLKTVVVIGQPGYDGWIPFDRFIAAQTDRNIDLGLSENTPFAMTFTGGTTGLPKGAMVSHQARFVSTYTTAIEHGVTETDIVGMITPFYHAMGSLVWLPTALYVGATAVIFDSWDPDDFAIQTEGHDITCSFMVPIQLRELLTDSHFDPKSLKTLNNIACGGATSPPGLVSDVNEKMPNTLFTNHYGQSETGPICFYRPSHPRKFANTVGRNAIGVELDIVDKNGNSVEVDESGEIIVRGPFLMTGYYDDPKETNSYFRNNDGWGWTGDLATKDKEGFITLVGRSKDMIVSGGVNIYPREVEIVLEKHPSIVDCTVFGIPDKRWGEALVGYIVAKDGSTPHTEDILNHCTEHLARFKRPKIIRIVDTIPKTPSGKVQKPKLRETFLKEYKTP
ncbi:MAG: class I adenylate-forming enzyme family protein [Pseudomonadota bacterium]|nr:class I adenylate-forming enzyme family protein [Pseudomonadota bacterium]